MDHVAIFTILRKLKSKPKFLGISLVPLESTSSSVGTAEFENGFTVKVPYPLRMGSSDESEWLDFREKPSSGVAVGVQLYVSLRSLKLKQREALQNNLCCLWLHVA